MTADTLDLFRPMLRIRRVEERLAQRYREQEIRCPMHLCIGQEAIAVGVMAALHPADRIYSNHRAHGHYLAKGGDLPRMIAELYGRETGCCRGRGGSMHLIDMAAGFMGSTPIVGGTVPLAVGAAWSAKLQDAGRVVAVFFGDGCFEEGVLHESMNFASLHKLPVLFICENNQYSVFTTIAERQPDRPIAAVAEAHGVVAAQLDGSDVHAVHRAASRAVAQARDGQGPQFLEIATYRWLEHCGPNDDSDLNYRPADELAYWKARCPITLQRNSLMQQGLLDQASLHKIEADLAQEIDAAFEFALRSPFPSLTALEDFVYA